MKNPLTLEAFAEWAERQPADKVYDYRDCAVCACGQYAASLGISKDWLTGELTGESEFWVEANYQAYHEPHNFGALAKRLREPVE